MRRKKALYFSLLNVFSTRVLIEDTIFKSSKGHGTAIFRGHASHAKVYRFARMAKVIPSFLSYGPARGSNPRPSAKQSRALPIELILPRSRDDAKKLKH